MLSFSDYFANQEQMIISEKLMTFGGKAYPKFGNVVLVVGGAGSGKGFQLDKLVGIEGKVFDVDALKMLAIKSTVFAARVKEETGYDLKQFDMKVPENVSKIHDILSSVYGTVKKAEQLAFTSVLAASPERKPNLVFDITMKDVAKLESITRNVSELGYIKENIHIVWVVNDVEVAMKQNQERSRTVPEEILMSTHEGAALTMKKVLDMGSKLGKYMNGDIYLSFNKVGVDTELAKSDKGGSYVKDADYVKVKEQGKAQKSSAELDQRIVDKIKEYTPDTNTW